MSREEFDRLLAEAAKSSRESALKLEEGAGGSTTGTGTGTKMNGVHPHQHPHQHQHQHHEAGNGGHGAGEDRRGNVPFRPPPSSTDGPAFQPRSIRDVHKERQPASITSRPTAAGGQPPQHLPPPQPPSLEPLLRFGSSKLKRLSQSLRSSASSVATGRDTPGRRFDWDSHQAMQESLPGVGVWGVREACTFWNAQAEDLRLSDVSALLEEYRDLALLCDELMQRAKTPPPTTTSIMPPSPFTPGSTAKGASSSSWRDR
jgi:hypothetical protein